jgi:ribosomal protein S18 acetylase RimI-like enzyme
MLSAYRTGGGPDLPNRLAHPGCAVPPTEIRPFRRSDRAQLTDLVNAHVDAVMPGVSLSPNAVLSQLEREPDEYVVDPWVATRTTLVAVQRDRLVGAAHLVTYGTEEPVATPLRGAGEFRWLLFWPGTAGAGEALTAASIGALRRAGAGHLLADGSLPVPAVYGVPRQWPHVSAALEKAGFTARGPVEVVLVADVADLPQPGPAPLGGLRVETVLGRDAPRLNAVLDGQVVGFCEVQADLTVGGTRSRLAGWADVWNLHVEPQHRGHGIGTWLLGHTAERLRLARVERVLSYAGPDGPELGLLLASGWRELTRTRRGWARDR